ncbi:MAG: Asp-tRNA(Asn)/Glu-tRNA(Gln) amidotransferase subunit GatA, partial [Acidimicrobiia bacterium]|nr:Asp-tRNA(Asn)/Glu-tRNA(Gln) amidotransferase subunit GatA [Acidimicrobiia bacterium]
GSAAAVAAGFASASFGSDTGGSIRQPAALCGLVGVKPTYGMVSRQGLVAFGSSLDQIGPFTTTVADAALLMEVIAGHDPLDSTSLPQPAPQLMSVLSQGVKGLRIGRVADMPEGSSPDVLARLDAAFDALRAAGATVVDVKLPSMSFGLTAYYLVAPAEASSNLARFDGVRYGLRVDAKDLNAMYGATRAAGFGDEVKRRIMLGTYALSAGYYDAYYGKALKVRRLIADDFAKAYEQCDAILTPTSPTVAFKFGLEVHVELATKTKLFSASANRFGDEPNTHIDPVTLGLPGALPVLNRHAVELAMRLGLALNCRVQPCTFHRKNYFYPDLPKAYQVSQYDQPLNVDGFLMLPGDVRIGIERAHLEEDTGKSTHFGGAEGRIAGSEYSTAPVCRLWRSSRGPTFARASKPSNTWLSCAQSCSQSVRATQRWKKARCAAT